MQTQTEAWLKHINIHTYLDIFPQYHSASHSRDGGSVELEAAAEAAAESVRAIRSWDCANAPKSCLISDPDRLRTVGAIAEATRGNFRHYR